MITVIDNIPEELKKVNNWVCAAKTDKIPKNPKNGKNAKSNDPRTWGTFEQAVKACEVFGFDYIGFEFSPPYFGVDLDHCLDNVEFCDEFVETLQSYAEISRSGDGLHIICKGALPDGSRRKGGVEMYSEGRYFICTGNIYTKKYTNITDCGESVKILYGKYLAANEPRLEAATPVELEDDELLDKARNCRSGAAFSMLFAGDWSIFPSQSEADLAMCNYLAFWAGRDEAQIDRLFRRSGLMREKWDRRAGAATYGERTIKKACASCVEIYNPSKHGDGADFALALFGKKQKPKEKQYDQTDTGNAHRLYDRYGRIIRYSYNRKKWYYWTGRVWVLDESGEIKKMADQICEELKISAYQLQDEDLQEQALKWARRTAGSTAKESMVKECQHLYDVPVSPAAFDDYSDYLNCQNGIVNLKNGELMPHSSELMLSKICCCEYDESHKPPVKWLKFLDDITGGNKELLEYIHRSVGYSLTGSGKEQCAYFLYGMGNNGKSTFLDVIADIMGDYAANTQPDTLMVHSKVGSLGGGANSDIARLKGARFVTCEEPTEGIRLNEGLLKQLTGGSKVTARFLYGDEFEFIPEFKLWVATNHKPVIRGTDVGIWRRIKLIPFEVNIPPEKVDKNLKYNLRSEYPQILAWAVEGCIKWQQTGSLAEPETVIDAVKEYRQEMDLIAAFMEQCVVIDYAAGGAVKGTDLFAIYRAWAKENNEWEMTNNRFGREMAKKVPEKVKTAKGVEYRGIRLTEYAMRLVPRQYRIEDFS